MAGEITGTGGSPQPEGFSLLGTSRTPQRLVFAAMLFGGLLLNRIFDPARRRLQQLDLREYELPETRTIGAQAHG
jgi:hypothetical protein